ncbi:MAG: putative metal-binding motif-containing protein [Myxococcota bacterium]
MTSQSIVTVVTLMMLSVGCGTKDGATPSNSSSNQSANDSADTADGETGNSDETGSDSGSDSGGVGPGPTDDTADSGGSVSPEDMDADRDGVTIRDGDCDDNDPDRYPGNTEMCNGIDNNCDGDVDKPAPADGTRWYIDLDSDDWGNAGVDKVACEQPLGFTLFPGDCDDSESEVFPGAIELCDTIDNNCDAIVDTDASDAIEFYRDADGDGYGNADSVIYACSVPIGYTDNALDCMDSQPSVNPMGVETCNGWDDDCDGTVDDGYPLSTWYRDGDGDGHGDPLTITTSCSPPASYVSIGGDCDDTDHEIHSDMAELCDEKDNDCDGIFDEELSDIPFYRDLDGDGYGTPMDSLIACSAPDGYVTSDADCDDADASVRPGRSEDCNGIDDNCDSIVDEGWPLDDYFADLDGDGFGAGVPLAACSLPPGYVASDTDCDDSEPEINPGMYADCPDGRDSDCDGEIDEGPDSTFYRDADGDGFGDAAVTVVTCAPPEGYVWDSTDCEDGHATAYPGAREVCTDSIDTDCDGLSDDTTLPVHDDDCDCPDHGYIEDEDIGSVTGDGVAEGSTVSEDDTFTRGSCGSSGAKDRLFLWTAPSSGCWRFDTDGGSDYDTLLRLLEPCEGTELACNDDGGTGLTSLITRTLEEGEAVIVVVDGYYSGSSGNYRLDINSCD